jgi:hypothetical protein
MSQPEYLRSPINPERARRRRRRLAALLITALPALALPVLVHSSADAVLASPTAAGPRDPATGFPSFYKDANGLALQPCLEGPPLCLTTEAELLGAGADGEGFYSSVTADAGGITLGLDLEAAYAEEGVDQEIVFARSQYSAVESLEPGQTYTVTDPYGSRQCTADASGSIKNNACRNDQGGAALAFDDPSLLNGRIGPFLTWDTFGSATGGPPAGYIGDGDSLHTIKGSPSDFNMFRVVGPGITTACVDGPTTIPNCDQTNQFVVSGKLAAGPMASLSVDSWNFGHQLAPVTKSFTYSSVGTTSVLVGAVDLTGAGFTKTSDTCSNTTQAAGDTCTIEVTYTPAVGAHATGLLEVADDVVGGSRQVALAGDGAQSAFGAMNGVDFLDVGVGRTATRDVTVTNAGTAPLALTKMSMSSTTSGYSVAGASLNPCRVGVTTLAQGASCTARVTFEPRSVGAKSASVLLGAADRATATEVTVLGSGQDVTRPTVLSKSPVGGATAVSRTGNVTVRFSEAVKGVRATTFKLTNLRSGLRRSATLSHTGSKWVLNPTRTLPPGTRFRVSLVGDAAAIRDASNLTLRSTSWTFRTR